MVAVSDFSGLINSPCALAKAAAMAPIDSLERCMAGIQAQHIEADRARFGTFRSEPVANRLLRIFWHEGLELGLCIFMFEVGVSRSTKYAGKLGPSIRRGHVDDPHSFDSGTRSFNAEEARGLAAFHTAPELLFRRQKQVLIERIG